MMINDMKKNELNELEMSGVAGGYSAGEQYIRLQQLERENGTGSEIGIGTGEVGAAWESVGTAWEVVKYAFELCG